MTILVGYPTNRRAKAVLSLAGMLARSSGEDVVVCIVAVDPRIPGVARDPGFRSYVDVLADNDVREGIKQYSNWPTIPQIYIHGQFVGGSDIVAELAARGELEALIKKS